MSSPVKRTEAEILESFMSKVDTTGPCWIWTGSQRGAGYGSAYSYELKKTTNAHRISYELLVGPIPVGMHIDHLCRVKLCVNPAHLEVVTCYENTMRGFGPTSVNAARTHCKHGHEFTPENTQIRNRGSGRRCSRSCRECERKRLADRWQRDKVAGREGT